MSEYKQKLNNQRHTFLLTFFADQQSEQPHYDWKEVNGFVLVKQWNGGTNEWEVAIFTKDSFIKSKSGSWGQTSPTLPDNQFTLPNDGGRFKTRQDVGGSTRPLPWETEGETDNR